MPIYDTSFTELSHAQSNLRLKAEFLSIRLKDKPVLVFRLRCVYSKHISMYLKVTEVNRASWVSKAYLDNHE